jgi:hypothetical protein
LRFEAKQRYGLLGRLEVLPYRGHGTDQRLFLRGRVLEEKGISRSMHDDSLWENLRNMARRFGSDEIAGARVRATFGDAEAHVVADEEASSASLWSFPPRRTPRRVGTRWIWSSSIRTPLVWGPCVPPGTCSCPGGRDSP